MSDSEGKNNDRMSELTAEELKKLEEEKREPKSEALEEEQEASEEKPEAKEAKQEASEEEPETEEAKQEASEEKPETEEAKQEASEEEPETEEAKQEASEEKSEAKEAKQEASEEKPETEEAKQEASEEEPEVKEPKQEASEEKPEAEEAKQEASEEEPEAEEAKQEASEEKPEAKEAKQEASEEKPETEETARQQIAAEAEVISENPYIITDIKKKKNVLRIVAFALLGVIFTVYAGGCIFFASHFGYTTRVDGVDVSLCSCSEAEAALNAAFRDYSLSIEGKDERSCKLQVSDIDMKVGLQDTIQEILRQQNFFLWPATFIEENALTAECNIAYDEELLKKAVYDSQLFDQEGYEAPRDAYITYDGKEIRIEKEFYGNTIFKGKLIEAVKQCLDSMETTLQLQDTDCYIKPQILSDNEELQERYALLKPFSHVKLTYELGIDVYEITPELYMDAIYADGNGEPLFDANRLKDIISDAAEKINTANTDRRFKTSTGKFVDVTGPYGYVLDEEQELVNLCKMLRNQVSERREPVYLQEGYVRRSLTDDIGNTYVEVNLSTQHIYVYYEGSLYLESGVVTGNPYKGNRTPGGIYGVSYKQSPAVLRGDDYETPVKYWMPFNGGIGLHDATWQSSFGGKRYLYHGSHGCVNLPLSVAQKIYKICEKGMPVICYYENGEHPNGRKR